jgi:hypothetical protein
LKKTSRDMKRKPYKVMSLSAALCSCEVQEIKDVEKGI